MGITIRNEISGKSEVIRNPLMPKHIRVGRVFWYHGYISAQDWECPGVITRVDRKKKRFWVRSLDDMEDQHFWYDFSISKDSQNSRKTMRLVPAADVKKYLARRLNYFVSRMKSAEDELKYARARLAKYRKGKRQLKL